MLDYLWVETYHPIDTPADFKFWYCLHEYDNELQDLPFENGTYDVMMSMRNPLISFRHSTPTVLKVMERIGPIWIEDFKIVLDSVRK